MLVALDDLVTTFLCENSCLAVTAGACLVTPFETVKEKLLLACAVCSKAGVSSVAIASKEKLC